MCHKDRPYHFKAIEDPAIAKVFESYPLAMNNKLLALRELILQAANSTEGVGKLEETLKWGEPAYVKTQSKSGSSIRIGWKKSHPAQYALYFHCQTTLIETFRALFPTELKFEGNRAVIFDETDNVPKEIITYCIVTALTYHLNKRTSKQC